MSTKRSTLRLILEIHCRVGESIATALRQIGRAPASANATEYASVWITRLPDTPEDTLEQEGMIRVYGPAPIHDAEIWREQLSFVLSRAGCEVEYDTWADD